MTQEMMTSEFSIQVLVQVQNDEIIVDMTDFKLPNDVITDDVTNYNPIFFKKIRIFQLKSKNDR